MSSVAMAVEEESFDGWGHDDANDGDGWGDTWGEDDGWGDEEASSPGKRSGVGERESAEGKAPGTPGS